MESIKAKIRGFIKEILNSSQQQELQVDENLMKGIELLPVNELVYLEEKEIELLVKAEDINYAFDEGFISDDDYVTYIQLNKAVGEITKGYDAGIVSETDYLAAVSKAEQYQFVKENDSYKLIVKSNEVELVDSEEQELIDRIIKGEFLESENPFLLQ